MKKLYNNQIFKLLINALRFLRMSPQPVLIVFYQSLWSTMLRSRVPFKS